MHRKTDMKRTYTTGDVARLLGTTPNTVTRWFEEGLLGGYRLPLGGERRIPLVNLRAFMWKHRIPLDLLEEDSHRYRRAHPRIPCDGHLQFSLINGDDHRPLPGRIENLSEGGVRIVYDGADDLALPRGARRIHIKVTDGPLAGMDIPAQLVHVTPRESTFAVGVRFGLLTDSQTRRIESAIGTTPVTFESLGETTPESPVDAADRP
ncbi:MAG: PilZ domain-containing protein [Deltaproteobacteria bacterium]|nr:PilZ domain-containing protein [Deltaproteobacteria bacterium]